MQSCRFAELQNCRGVEVQKCTDDRCRGAELQSCRAAEVQRCRAAELQTRCRRCADRGVEVQRMCRVFAEEVGCRVGAEVQVQR